MLHAPTDPTVRHFHQILPWLLELMPSGHDDQDPTPWQRLLEDQAAGTWREVDDEFPSDPAQFQERHYSEFVTFLPYVQRSSTARASRARQARRRRRSGSSAAPT